MKFDMLLNKESKLEEFIPILNKILNGRFKCSALYTHRTQVRVTFPSFGGCSRGIMAKLFDYGLEVSEFEL